MPWSKPHQLDLLGVQLQTVLPHNPAMKSLDTFGQAGCGLLTLDHWNTDIYLCIVRMWVPTAQLVQETRWCQTTRRCRAETGGDQERIPAERQRLMLSLQTDDHQNRPAGFCQRGKTGSMPVQHHLGQIWTVTWTVKCRGPRRPTAKAVKASPLVQIQIVSKLLHCGSLDQLRHERQVGHHPVILKFMWLQRSLLQQRCQLPSSGWLANSRSAVTCLPCCQLVRDKLPTTWGTLLIYRRLRNRCLSCINILYQSTTCFVLFFVIILVYNFVTIVRLVFLR